MSANNTCEYCDVNPAILKCGSCGSSFYCSTRCQKNDWINGHKDACKIISSDITDIIVSNSKDSDSIEGLVHADNTSINIKVFNDEFESKNYIALAPNAVYILNDKLKSVTETIRSQKDLYNSLYKTKSQRERLNRTPTEAIYPKLNETHELIKQKTKFSKVIQKSKSKTLKDVSYHVLKGFESTKNDAAKLLNELREFSFEFLLMMKQTNDIKSKSLSEDLKKFYNLKDIQKNTSQTEFVNNLENYGISLSIEVEKGKNVFVVKNTDIKSEGIAFKHFNDINSIIDVFQRKQWIESDSNVPEGDTWPFYSEKNTSKSISNGLYRDFISKFLTIRIRKKYEDVATDFIDKKNLYLWVVNSIKNLLKLQSFYINDKQNLEVANDTIIYEKLLDKAALNFLSNVFKTQVDDESLSTDSPKIKYGAKLGFFKKGPKVNIGPSNVNAILKSGVTSINKLLTSKKKKEPTVKPKKKKKEISILIKRPESEKKERLKRVLEILKFNGQIEYIPRNILETGLFETIDDFNVFIKSAPLNKINKTTTKYANLVYGKGLEGIADEVSVYSVDQMKNIQDSQEFIYNLLNLMSLQDIETSYVKLRKSKQKVKSKINELFDEKSQDFVLKILQWSNDVQTNNQINTNSIKSSKFKIPPEFSFYDKEKISLFIIDIPNMEKKWVTLLKSNEINDVIKLFNNYTKSLDIVRDLDFEIALDEFQTALINQYENIDFEERLSVRERKMKESKIEAAKRREELFAARQKRIDKQKEEEEKEKSKKKKKQLPK